MRLGHGPAVVVRVATDYNQMLKWALNFALCGEVTQSLHAMSSNEQERCTLTTKKKPNGRIKIEQAVRLSLCHILEVAIDI